MRMVEVEHLPNNDHFFKVDLDLIEHGGDSPIVGSVEYNQISAQVYGAEWIQPLFRVDGRFIKPEHQSTVPCDTLAVPESMSEDLTRQIPASETPVLVARRDYAKDYVRL